MGFNPTASSSEPMLPILVTVQPNGIGAVSGTVVPVSLNDTGGFTTVQHQPSVGNGVGMEPSTGSMDLDISLAEIGEFGPVPTLSSTHSLQAPTSTFSKPSITATASTIATTTTTVTTSRPHHTVTAHCSFCKKPLATLYLYTQASGDPDPKTLPFAVDLICEGCGPPPNSAEKNRTVGQRRWTRCQLCRKGIGTGGVRGGLGDTEEWQNPGFGVEAICWECFGRFSFCTNCGGGGLWRSGKWRPKELFQPPRKTCTLDHSRSPSSPHVISIVYRVPKISTPTSAKFNSLDPAVYGCTPNECLSELGGVPYVSKGASLVDMQEVERAWMLSRGVRERAGEILRERGAGIDRSAEDFGEGLKEEDGVYLNGYSHLIEDSCAFYSKWFLNVNAEAGRMRQTLYRTWEDVSLFVQYNHDQMRDFLEGGFHDYYEKDVYEGKEFRRYVSLGFIGKVGKRKNRARVDEEMSEGDPASSSIPQSSIPYTLPSTYTVGGCSTVAWNVTDRNLFFRFHGCQGHFTMTPNSMLTSLILACGLRVTSDIITNPTLPEPDFVWTYMLKRMPSGDESAKVKKSNLRDMEKFGFRKAEEYFKGDKKKEEMLRDFVRGKGAETDGFDAWVVPWGDIRRVAMGMLKKSSDGGFKA
ncbi:hypothetical protein HDU67_006175 [Dinochytrium kinnereticum]|nr:hypothetical protein HDU67_006175 [Dinochytrium kinnereticum]